MTAEIWQSNFRKGSLLGIGSSPASIAAGSSQVRVEEERPARYLSMKEVSCVDFVSSTEDDEVDGVGVALILSFSRS